MTFMYGLKLLTSITSGYLVEKLHNEKEKQTVTIELERKSVTGTK